MAGSPQTNRELTTWVQISAYLKVSVRQAQLLEKFEGLPVRRQGSGKKPGVSALTDDLDKWKAVRLARALESAAVATANDEAAIADKYEAHQPSTNGKVGSTEPRALPIPHPSPGADTPEVSATPATAETVEAAPLLRQPLSQRRWLQVGIGAFGILLGGWLILYWLIVAHGQMVDFKADGATLIGLNEHKQALWQHTFPKHLMPWPYANPARPTLTWLGDLDGDGKSSLLFTAVLSKDDGPADDQLLCFDRYGNMRWQRPFTPGRSVRDIGGVMVPPFTIVRVMVMTGRTPDETRIVVSSIHHSDQPCQVAILDRQGRVLAEYWHPGHVRFLAQVDLNGDGRKELLLGGVNNGEHRATVVVLDPWQMSGISTPAAMTDQRFRLLDMPVANEKAVVLFPRSCISKGQSYTRVAQLLDLKGRLEVLVAEGTDEHDPGFVYELDYSLRPISVVASGDDVKRAHEALEAAGKLDHSYTADNWDSLKNQVEVRRGK